MKLKSLFEGGNFNYVDNGIEDEEQSKQAWWADWRFNFVEHLLSDVSKEFKDKAISDEIEGWLTHFLDEKKVDQDDLIKFIADDKEVSEELAQNYDHSSDRGSESYIHAPILISAFERFEQDLYDSESDHAEHQRDLRLGR